MCCRPRWDRNASAAIGERHARPDLCNRPVRRNAILQPAAAEQAARTAGRPGRSTSDVRMRQMSRSLALALTLAIAICPLTGALADDAKDKPATVTAEPATP